MSSRSCCLCSAKSPQVSLHSFPKDVPGMNEWKQICRYEVYDDVSRLFICSNHFVDDDYVSPNAKFYGGRLKLKSGRFPSVDVPNKLYEQVLSTSSKFVEDIKIMKQGPSTLSSSLELPKQDDEVVHTPKKRKFHEPRYLNEIKSPHLATPRKAKRALNLALNQVKKLEMKNNVYRLRNKRLLKKVTIMQEMLKHRKQNDSLSEKADDTLMNEKNTQQETSTNSIIETVEAEETTCNEVKRQKLIIRDVSQVNEAYASMKESTSKRTGQRDEYDLYGEQIAMKLRKMDELTRTETQYRLNCVIYEAEIKILEQHKSQL